jgi:hypothetical protein
MNVLKETAEEQGCFRGCAVFVGIGAFVGLIGGAILINVVFPEFKQINVAGLSGGVISGSIGAFIGIIIGAIMGAVVGLVWGKFATKQKLTEEEF